MAAPPARPLRFDSSVSYVSDLGAIVYGYGGNEDESPLKDTVDLLDKLVKEYVAGMTEMAVDVAVARGALDVNCFKRLFKADLRKGARMAAVLDANKKLQEALRVDLGEGILNGPPPDRRKQGKPKPPKKRKPTNGPGGDTTD